MINNNKIDIEKQNFAIKYNISYFNVDIYSQEFHCITILILTCIGIIVYFILKYNFRFY